MGTVIDLGQQVRLKYPQRATEWANLTDEDLGRQVKSWYPEAYADYEDIPPMPPDIIPGFGNVQANVTFPGIQPGAPMPAQAPDVVGAPDPIAAAAQTVRAAPPQQYMTRPETPVMGPAPNVIDRGLQLLEQREASTPRSAYEQFWTTPLLEQIGLIPPGAETNNPILGYLYNAGRTDVNPALLAAAMPVHKIPGAKTALKTVGNWGWKPSQEEILLGSRILNDLPGEQRTFTQFASKADETGLAPEKFPRLFKESTKRHESFEKAAKNALPATWQLMEMWKEGLDARDWYPQANKELTRVFGQDANLIMDMLAATSPNTKVEGNFIAAMKAYARYKAGKSFIGPASIPGVSNKGFLPVHVKGLDQIKAGGVATGPKVEPFGAALKGDVNAVPVDLWMMDAFGFKGKSPTDWQRAYIQNAINEIATRTGDTPRAVQARIWEAARRRAGETSAGTFHDLTGEKNVYQISMELTHGPKSPAVKRFPLDAKDTQDNYLIPYSERLAITQEVTGKIVTSVLQKYQKAKGPDKIYVVGAPTGPGGYLNYPMNPSLQLQIVAKKETVQKIMGELGFRLEQREMIASKLLDPAENPGNFNGFKILADGPVMSDPGLLEPFWRDLQAAIPEFQGFAPTEGDGMVGIDILNIGGYWTPADIARFKQITEQVARKHGILDSGQRLGLAEHLTDPLSVINEWGENGQQRGQSHRLWANPSGSPALERRLDDSHWGAERTQGRNPVLWRNQTGATEGNVKFDRGSDYDLERKAWLKRPNARRVLLQHEKELQQRYLTGPTRQAFSKHFAAKTIREAQGGPIASEPTGGYGEAEQLQLPLKQAQQAAAAIQKGIPVRSSRGSYTSPLTGQERKSLSSSGAKLKGLAIDPAATIRKKGRVDVRGLYAESPEDIAKIAEVFRNPSFESTYILYVKNGIAVAHEAHTSRMPGFTRIAGDNEAKYFYEVQDRAKRLGADAVYTLHNHPGGIPRPSDDDLKAIIAIRGKLGDLHKGEVIIDHDTFGWVDSKQLRDMVGGKGQVSSHVIEQYKDAAVQGKAVQTSQDPLHRESIAHKELGRKIIGPNTVFAIGKTLRNPKDSVALIYRDSPGYVRAIETVPVNLFKREKDFADWALGRTRIFGGRAVIAYYKDSSLDGIANTHVRNNVLLDAVAPVKGKSFDYTSARDYVTPNPQKFFNRKFELKFYKAESSPVSAAAHIIKKAK